jgi:predicted nucleic acid-binding protein
MNAIDKPLCFVDSNIWLYAFIEAPESDKSQLARSIITASRTCINDLFPQFNS